MKRLEAAFYSGWSQRGESSDRFGNALEISMTKVCQLEQIAEQPSRGVRDHHHVWLGKRLQSCRKIGRLADNSALLRLARSDQIPDHHQTRGDADPGLQRSLCLQFCYFCDQLQRRPYGPLGVILVSFRVAVEPTKS
jgi:hypothetical protein